MFVSTSMALMRLHLRVRVSFLCWVVKLVRYYRVALAQHAICIKLVRLFATGPTISLVCSLAEAL